MPFHYALPMPTIPDDKEVAVLEKWELAERSLVSAGSAIATVRAGEKRFLILANGEGVLRKQTARPGDVVRIGQELGQIAADGENIPYGRPYSVVVEI